MKICSVCKHQYKENSNSQKYCSSVCFKEHMKIYTHTDDYIKKHKAFDNKFRHSKYFKQYIKDYRKSSDTYKNYKYDYIRTDKYKEKRKAFRKSLYYKEYIKKYNNSTSGKLVLLRKELKRREAENNCIHDFSNDEWRRKCELVGTICPNCNNLFDNGIHKLTLDHVFALYWANEYFKQTGKKFVYKINDVEPICLSCNSSKRNKLIEESKPKDLNTHLS